MTEVQLPAFSHPEPLQMVMVPVGLDPKAITNKTRQPLQHNRLSRNCFDLDDGSPNPGICCTTVQNFGEGAVIAYIFGRKPLDDSLPRIARHVIGFSSLRSRPPSSLCQSLLSVVRTGKSMTPLSSVSSTFLMNAFNASASSYSRESESSAFLPLEFKSEKICRSCSSEAPK